ncbi:hypothetical protein LXL04_039206 [Taraxacum kok-saghyz]
MKTKMMIATYTASATPTRLRLHQNINQVRILLLFSMLLDIRKHQASYIIFLVHINSISHTNIRSKRFDFTRNSEVFSLLEIQKRKKQEIVRFGFPIYSKFRSKKSEVPNSGPNSEGNQKVRIQETSFYDFVFREKSGPILTKLHRASEISGLALSVDKTATRRRGFVEGTQPASLPIAGEESVSIRMSKTTCLLSQTRDSSLNSSAIGGSGSTQDTQPASLPISGEGNVPNTTDSMQSQKVGIVMRKFCPLEFHTWENVPNENKEEMIDHFHPSNHLFLEARDMFCPPDQEKTSTSCDMDDLSDEE